MPKRQVWITDNSNIKYQKIKSSFLQAMQQQSKQQKINYYDFLLVAKKLYFRFEQSSHLMAFKNYFAKNKNLVNIKKIADILCVSQESLNAQEEKIIVKFNVPQTEFAPIKEQTHQDEQNQGLSEADLGNQVFQKIGSNTSDQQQREINEKIAVILSIKVDEMQKKIQALTNQKQKANLIALISQHDNNTSFSYQDFKHLVIAHLEESKEHIRISEDDIKTLFFVLDQEKQGEIAVKEIRQLTQITTISAKLKEFYRTRINRDMVKNTLFKLGKVKNNTIQIYQVKNASLLQFENMQKSILEENEHSFNRLKKIKIPHFGPLKGAAIANKQRQTMPSRINNKPSLSTQISHQRQRIQKILRVSKQQKRRDKKGQTVASKLRSLFIHKVILPREKMLQEQKDRYLRNKTIQNDLFIKSNHPK